MVCFKMDVYVIQGSFFVSGAEIMLIVLAISSQNMDLKVNMNPCKIFLNLPRTTIRLFVKSHM
jgi:hypothetical protein